MLEYCIRAFKHSHIGRALAVHSCLVWLRFNIIYPNLKGNESKLHKTHQEINRYTDCF